MPELSSFNRDTQPGGLSGERELSPWLSFYMNRFLSENQEDEVVIRVKGIEISLCESLKTTLSKS